MLVTSGRDAFEVGFTLKLIAQAPPDYRELGTLTVNQLGALLQNAAGFLGVDSMPMHLAAALGKPGIALFGPTDEKVWGPWHSNLTVLRTDCRCLHRTRSCPQGPESQCLVDLSAEVAIEKLAVALRKS